MSGIGHFAAGFAAKSFAAKSFEEKSAAPQVPLWVFLAASETNELLYFLFSSAGIESKAVFTMDFDRGVRYLTPGSNPWSHGLFMSIVWSVAAAAVALLFYRNRQTAGARQTAGVIGLVVFSHWVLDFLMHSNLPLFFDGSPMVGLGLENSGPGFIFMTVLDLVLLAGGITLYLVSRKRASEVKINQTIEAI